MSSSIIYKWVSEMDKESIIITSHYNLMVIYDANSKNTSKYETLHDLMKNQKDVTTSLKSWVVELDTVKEYLISKNLMDNFEYYVLFELFPKYSECNNIPYLWSDFKSFNRIEDFFSILDKCDQSNLTTINKRIKLMFDLNFVDQAIIHLMGDKKLKIKSAILNFSDLENLCDGIISIFKANTTKKNINKTDLEDLVIACKAVGSSVINTMLLVIFKCIEKSGNKTNYFKRFVK